MKEVDYSHHHTASSSFPNTFSWLRARHSRLGRWKSTFILAVGVCVCSSVCVVPVVLLWKTILKVLCCQSGIHINYLKQCTTDRWKINSTPAAAEEKFTSLQTTAITSFTGERSATWHQPHKSEESWAKTDIPPNCTLRTGCCKEIKETRSRATTSTGFISNSRFDLITASKKRRQLGN